MKSTIDLNLTKNKKKENYLANKILCTKDIAKTRLLLENEFTL